MIPDGSGGERCERLPVGERRIRPALPRRLGQRPSVRCVAFRELPAARSRGAFQRHGLWYKRKAEDTTGDGAGQNRSAEEERDGQNLHRNRPSTGGEVGTEPGPGGVAKPGSGKALGREWRGRLGRGGDVPPDGALSRGSECGPVGADSGRLSESGGRDRPVPLVAWPSRIPALSATAASDRRGLGGRSASTDTALGTDRGGDTLVGRTEREARVSPARDARQIPPERPLSGKDPSARGDRRSLPRVCRLDHRGQGEFSTAARSQTYLPGVDCTSRWGDSPLLKQDQSSIPVSSRPSRRATTRANATGSTGFERC